MFMHVFNDFSIVRIIHFITLSKIMQKRQYQLASSMFERILIPWFKINHFTLKYL